MRIATWNVNSARKRLPHIIDFLNDTACDVLLLQEIKCVTEDFPTSYFEDLGYTCAIFGQKTFNGVAIISKYSLEDIQFTIPHFTDPQARYIEAVVDGRVRVASVYAPNGESLESEKYIYKEKFYKALHTHLIHRRSNDEIFLIGGDYNIAPRVCDTYDPEKWEGDILCSLKERSWFRCLLNAGYRDIMADLYGKEAHFTWWDYRRGSYEKNYGLRIDHFLTNPKASDCVEKVWIDHSPRVKETPSDHTPVVCQLML
jgi:exodeoxyribonuclease-3